MKKLGLILICLAAFFAVESSASRYRRATKTIKLLTAYVGSSVTLTCDVSMTKFTVVEWRRNDSTNAVLMQFETYNPTVERRYLNRVVLKDKMNLQISNLNVGDDNVYYCKVVDSNTGGAAELGSPIKLTVLDSPRCEGTPAGLFVAKVVGSTGLLPCNVAGNPFPEIVWTKNNGILPEGRYAVTNDGLTIKHLKKEDSGYYQVTLKSVAGTTEVVIQLIVKTTASVLPGHYIDAVEGQMQSIPCGKDKVTKDSKLTWKRSGADPTKDSRFTLNTASGSLVINRVNRKDAGSYNCSVMKIVDGQITFKTYEMYFNVQYRPEIIYHLVEETAVVNETVSLPCVAIGNPSANVTWEWNGKPIKSDSHFIVGRNGSLVIENVTRKDEGVFTCTPFNKWFGEKKQTKLVVLVPPRFKTTPSFIQKVRIGTNVTFDCSATGIPEPNITWPPVWTSWPKKRVLTFKDGRRKIVGVQLSDHGRYRCVVVSEAGIISRDFMLFLIAKPYKPVNITTKLMDDAINVSWMPHSKGLIVQDFELWYRPLHGTDFEWKSMNFRQSGNETVNFTSLLKDDNIIRLRGKNDQGFGPFSDAYKVFGNGSSIHIVESPRDAKTPLAPYNMQVNISVTGYIISWDTKYAPNRPQCKYFIIEAKQGNSSWAVIGGKISKSTREYTLRSSDIELGVLYSFRMYAVGQFSSEAAKPKVNYFGMPEIPTMPAVSPAASKGKYDPLPAIILGVMFSVFVLILIISLIFFLRATGRLGGSRARSRQNGRLLDEKLNESELNSNGMGTTKSSNGIKISGGKMFYKKNPKHKKPFHYENCPIKLVSDYENGEYEKLLLESSAHVIFSESPEKCQCDHRRCMTLPRKPGARVKKAKANGLYKSVSSPNVITSSNGKVSEHDITAETTINDNDYDLYDSEDDDFVDSKFPTIDRKFSKMKNSKMIDSYDQFCRSPSDFGSKDLATPRNQQNPKQNDVDFYVSPHDDDEKLRMLSPTESENAPSSPVVPKDESTEPDESDQAKIPDKQAEKLAEQTEIQSDTGTPERGSKENVFDDPNDASSENSVAESDQRVFALTASRLRHPPAKPGYAVRKLSQEESNPEKRLSFDRGLTAIKETPSKVSLNSIDKHSLRSYELRSSGFESEGKLHSYTSDTESAHNSIPPVTGSYKFKDVDVMSDISTRSSPGPLRRSAFHPGYDEHYEFDIPKHRTYGRPIYNSPRREKFGSQKDTANNEDLFQSIMKMQQQLGVDLADSWENLSEDTNLSLVYNSQTPFYRDGYSSDVPSSFTDRVSSYSEREKARRCAELLQELKRNTPTKVSTLPRSTHSVKRSQSAVSDYMRTKPILPPFKRSNSACEEETVFHEWLV